MIGSYTQPLSQQLWNAAAVGAGTNSPTFRAWSRPFVSVFGNVSGAATITLMLSADGINWYAGPTATTAGAGNFFIAATVGVEFLALQSSASLAAVTALISAK